MKHPFYQYMEKKKMLLQDFGLHWLLGVAVLLLFTLLGTREIWTHEWRGADVIWEMIRRRDYLHPYFGIHPYYDKPLLSYWLMLICSYLLGGLSEWSLRIPSAIAGISVLCSSYFIGCRLIDKKLALLTGWLLLSNYFFVFWSRTATSDILNVAGIMLAVAWYCSHKNKPGFFSFSVFFILLALTSLLKGLIGAIIPLLLIAPDLCYQHNWRKYLNRQLFFSLLPAFIIYFIPFCLSAWFAKTDYHANGLLFVFRENFVRYFQPFDHDDPFFTYFLYLPIYLLPWSLFFPFAIFSLKRRWKTMQWEQKWPWLATGLVFIFLTLSRSRRSYYVLPLIPFSSLIIADWMIYWTTFKPKVSRHLNYALIALLFLMFSYFCVLQPLYYLKGGTKDFAKKLMLTAEKIHPWQDWHVVLFNAKDKVLFYMKTNTRTSELRYLSRTKKNNLQSYPFLRTHPVLFCQNNSILITTLRHKSLIEDNLKGHYQLVNMPDHLLSQKTDLDDPIAFLIF